jgi:hypothetical protein
MLNNELLNELKIMIEVKLKKNNMIFVFFIDSILNTTEARKTKFIKCVKMNYSVFVKKIALNLNYLNKKKKIVAK